MKKLFFAVLFPTLMSAQFVAKKGKDPVFDSPTIVVNVGSAATFSPADALATDRNVYMSFIGSKYIADVGMANQFLANVIFEGMAAGNCLQAFEGTLTLTYEDGSEAPLTLQSDTSCEVKGKLTGEFFLDKTDYDKMKTTTIKKMTVLTKDGPVSFDVKPEKAKAIQATIALIEKSKF